MKVYFPMLGFALCLWGSSAAGADLVEAYNLARQSDPQLSAAENRLRAESENIVQARSNLLPQVSGAGNFSESDRDSTASRLVSLNPPIPDVSTSNAETFSRNWSLSLSQSIYDHSNYTRLKASRTRASRAEADFAAARNDLMVRVADAYFQVLTTIETLASSRAEERSVKRQLEQAEMRLEVGLSPITDVHEARARYDTSRANTIASQNAYEDALEALAEVTGQAMSGLRGLSPDFVPQLPEVTDSETWVKLALDNNPVLQARLLDFQAAKYDIATARAGHYPTLSATANYSDDFSSTDIRTRGQTFPTANDSDGYTIGVRLDVPIFTGFATQSRVRQAVSLRDASEDQAEQQRRAVTRQTRNAFRALIAGIAEVEARRLAVVSATSALEATEAGFEVGTRTIVDVLISQQQLFSAQREYAQARNLFMVNTLRLKQSAGTIAADDVIAVNTQLVADAEAMLEAAENEPVR
jgi:outer membrane protein